MGAAEPDAELDGKVLGHLGRLTIGGFRSAVYRALRALEWDEWGEERIRPHQLRALFSDRLMKAGASLPVFIALTGHSPETAARHYWEARPDEKHEAVLKAGIATDLDVSIVAMPVARYAPKKPESHEESAT